MYPTTAQRVEGVAVLAAALGTLWWLEADLLLVALLALAPDLSMLGYLAGPRVGARTYNLAHVYAGPLGLVGIGLWAGLPLAVVGGVVWAAHVGADRAVGYGLKYADGFGSTHLDGAGATPAGGAAATGPGSDSGPVPDPNPDPDVEADAVIR